MPPCADDSAKAVRLTCNCVQIGDSRAHLRALGDAPWTLSTHCTNSIPHGAAGVYGDSCQLCDKSPTLLRPLANAQARCVMHHVFGSVGAGLMASQVRARIAGRAHLVYTAIGRRHALEEPPDKRRDRKMVGILIV